MAGFSCEFCHSHFEGVANKCIFCDGQFCSAHTPADSHACSGRQSTRVWDKSKPLKQKSKGIATLVMVLVVLAGVLLGVSFRPPIPTVHSALSSPPTEDVACAPTHSLYIPYSSAIQSDCLAATD